MADHGARRKLTAGDLDEVRGVIERAWSDLPGAHRRLLEAIGADRRAVVDRPLGEHVEDLIVSAGGPGLSRAERTDLDRALGVWLHDLRLVLVDAGHRSFAGLDARSYEWALARVAWHEWGHALSITRASPDDLAEGRQLLDLAPAALAGFIREAGYRPREYVHELIAETYALLMSRRRRGQHGRPAWLDQGLYELARRLTGWSE